MCVLTLPILACIQVLFDFLKGKLWNGKTKAIKSMRFLDVSTLLFPEHQYDFITIIQKQANGEISWATQGIKLLEMIKPSFLKSFLPLLYLAF